MWHLKKVEKLATKAIRVASEVAEVAIHYQQNQGPLGMLSVGARALNALQEMREGNNPLEGWEDLNIRRLAASICSFLEKQGPCESQKGPHGDGRTVITEVYGYQFGFAVFSDWTEGPKIPPGQDRTASKDALGRLLWERLGNTVQIKSSLAGDYLESDDLTDCLGSAQADEIYDEYRAFHQSGFNRSFLLYGKPGTGKSYIMRRVAKLAGGFSLRIDAASLSNVQSAVAAIDILKPSAVIIDDIDRLDHPESILGPMERLTNSTSLILASANKEKNLDFAALRVGRFDRLWRIESLDESVRRRLTGDLPAEALEHIDTLPVAYLSEFRKIVCARGVQEAIRRIPELEAHAQLVQQVSDAEDGESDEDPSVPPIQESINACR